MNYFRFKRSKHRQRSQAVVPSQNMDKFLFSIVLVVLLGLIVFASAQEATDKKENEPISEEQLEYAKGSLCTYCDYCKFCKLCDADCPCEVSKSKPNCHLCKYCKFCYLCKACDTVCQPGGIIDTVTSTLFSSLPSFNKEEVDSDIHQAKEWIDLKKDEL